MPKKTEGEESDSTSLLSWCKDPVDVWKCCHTSDKPHQLLGCKQQVKALQHGRWEAYRTASHFFPAKLSKTHK